MKKIVYYIILILIAVMILLSVCASFFGADRVQVFLSSLPLTVYWFFVIFLAAAAILSFRQLCRPSLFLIHIGTVLILFGSVLSSEKGGDIQSQIFILQVVSDNGPGIVYTGYAAICLGIIWHFWFVKLRQS